jgi:DNA-binding MarR family transcriptional regulator
MSPSFQRCHTSSLTPLTAVSRQVSKLEERGLVKRQNSKRDSRVKQAYLTSRGRELTERISVVREARAMRALERRSRKDLRDLAKLMRRLADDLQPIR